MNISIGIIGLPNVGKSTLFNAVLKKTVAESANYPFCTIEPNVGVVEVPDERLNKLAKISKSEKIIPAVVELYDIAGLVKGASEGEGLGNKFLAHIREVSAIIHVARLFEDKNITHVDEKINPIGDIQTIETELILADLATLEKQKEPKGKVSKEDTQRWEIIKKVKKLLDKGIYLGKTISLNSDSQILAQKLTSDDMPTIDDYKLISHLNLLSLKPVIYVFNVSEEQLENPKEINSKIENLTKNYKLFTTNYLLLSAKMENEVLALTEEEQIEYLNQYNLTSTGLDRLVKKAYQTLGLISFLTTGEKETRAWTIKKDSLAPQAAGVIHTDFEKNFIKADIVKYDDFIKSNGWTAAREKGLVHSAGKDYTMQDGDVVEFKVGRG
jgi:hypothetical protein